MTQPEQQSNSPVQFQVIYRTSDRMIVGMSPKGGGVGPNNRLAVIHEPPNLSSPQYVNLMRYDPAYLDPDGTTIVGAPPA